MKRALIKKLKQLTSFVLISSLCVPLLAMPVNAVAINPTTQQVAYDNPPADWRNPQRQDNTWESTWHSDRELPPRQLGLNVQGTVPVLLPHFGNQYQHINEAIDNVVDFLIADARRSRARSITFAYEMRSHDGVVSVLVRASVSGAIYRTLVRSINFCQHTGQLIDITQAMDNNVIPLANRILSDRMRHNPEEFYGLLSVSLEEQAFFVSQNGVTILFDEFQLSSMVSGIFPLELKNSNINTITLLSGQTLPSTNAYNLLMVPLRLVAEGLGYSVRRCPVEDVIEVYLRDVEGNIQIIAWLTPGINEFRTQDSLRTLEATPIRVGHHIYVPITFFDHVLPSTVYNLDTFGNITFLAYLD